LRLGFERRINQTVSNAARFRGGSPSAEFLQAALFGRKFCVKCQINLNSAKAGPAKHVCHHGTWKNLSKNHACQLGCHPNICHEIFRASCSAPNECVAMLIFAGIPTLWRSNISQNTSFVSGFVD
jgi:hypothetical protein